VLETKEIIMIVMVSFICSFILIYPTIKLSFEVGGVDNPNYRRLNKKPMPNLGGLAIYGAFLIAYMVFGQLNTQMISILIGSFILVVFGILDSIHSLSAKIKIIGHIAAACVIVFYGNILLKEIGAFGINIDFGDLSYLVTIFFIVGCINCINFIDGMDGLSSGICSIYFLTIGIIAAIQGKLGGLDVILAFIMLGSTLGYLCHNFPPAKIYMGEVGSSFLGFIISVIALLGFKNVTMTSLIIPLLILAIPILDTLFAILRRLLKHESISKPDKLHLHHQLLKKNLSTRKALLAIYVIDALFAAASIVYVLKDAKLGYILYGMILIIVIGFVLTTDVVFEHTPFNNTPKIHKKEKLKKEENENNE